MTAALGNTGPGTPFATGVDSFVYPQFIGYALRQPTTKDIYNPGTRWQDNSVSPAVIYVTTGSGLWYTIAGGGESLTSLTVNPGPTNIVGTTTLNTAGSGVTTIGTGGTGATNIGNATGATNVTGALNVTGNLNLSSVATYIQMNGGAVTDFIGTATLVSGTVTIANTNITAADRILVVHSSPNASTGIGTLTYSISASTSFTVTSLTATATTEAGDLSSIVYVIFRQT